LDAQGAAIVSADLVGGKRDGIGRSESGWKHEQRSARGSGTQFFCGSGPRDEGCEANEEDQFW
jgi:hypothetical protein